MPHRILNPENWKAPKGYSNAVSAKGRMIFIAGQIGWNENCEFESTELIAQVEQTLKNIVEILRLDNAAPEHIVRMIWFVIDKQDYLNKAKEIGAVYREIMGSNYPAMSLVEVKSLLEDKALVEIEATAVIPE